MADGVPDNHHSEQRNIVSESTESNIVQAGVVHGDVHIYSPSIPEQSAGRLPIPRQLIPPPARFANRNREQGQLDAARREATGAGPTVLVLRGPGGVGKTALALHWLGLRAADFPDGQLYAELAEPDGQPVAPDDVLGRYLRALGVAPARVPAGFAERTALFRSFTAGRSLAVLLDNVVSTAQVRVLLPASPTSLVLATSRRPLVGLLAEGARTIAVDPLSTTHAVELLSHRIGPDRVAAEQGSATSLARLCGGLPVALCVAAALTVARPRRSLARTVHQLSVERQRLTVLSVEGELSVRGAFDMSYVDISEAARRAYRVLGLYPGEDFGVDVLAAALDVDRAAAQDVLDELADASLVEEIDEGRFRLHDLIREHARERATEDSVDVQEDAVRRMAEWYLRAALTANAVVLPARRQLSYEFPPSRTETPDGLDRHDNAIGWLERERRNLAALVRAAADRGWTELTHQLGDALQPLFIVHRHERDAVELGEIVLAGAVAGDDPVARDNMRKRLARTYSRLGEFDRARTHLAAMLADTRARGDRRGEASALKSEALLLARSGRPESAVDVFHQTLAILDELDARHGQGLTLINLGEVLIALGRFGEAIDELESARTLLSAPDRRDVYNATRAAIVLGQAQLGAGNHAVARDLLHAALDTMTELDAPAEQAKAHRALAELAARTGDTAAEQRHEQAAARLTDPG